MNDEAKRWYDTYQNEVNARDEFFGYLLELLPGAEETGMDAYDQIPRAIKALRAERDELWAAIGRVRAIERSPGTASGSSFVRGQDCGWDEALAAANAALSAPESPVTASTPSTPGTEAHSEAGEDQEGSQ